MNTEKNTIRLDDLVDQMAEILTTANVKITKGDLSLVISNTFNTIAQNLTNGNEVAIHKFGIFSVRERDARSGRNPRTGAPINIPKSIAPYFKISGSLKDIVNGRTKPSESKVKTSSNKSKPSTPKNGIAPKETPKKKK